MATQADVNAAWNELETSIALFIERGAAAEELANAVDWLLEEPGSPNAPKAVRGALRAYREKVPKEPT